MATKDPNSRLTEGSLNSPSYTAPNGPAEPRAAVQPDLGRRDDESPGEKIGRFFRRAMDRLSGHEEEDPRGDDRREREDRSFRERNRRYGRSGQAEWRDLGRSGDDRSLSYRSGPTGDTNDERYRSGSGGVGYGQGTTGRPWGQGQGVYGQGQGSYAQGQGGYGQGAYGQESRGSSQSLGQRGLGRSPGESYGLGEIPSERPIGSERGFQGDQGRDDWNRGDWNRGEGSRGEWNRGEWNRGPERWSARGQSGASGVTPSSTGGGYAGSGASFGFGRDEQRAGDWGEIARDRDEGQGRRFWQREPLAARDVMTRNPKTVTRQSSIREAAVIMRDENCGVVPVADVSGRLEGILTDRDVAVRGLVKENSPALRVEDVMTDDVSAVTEDEPLTSVLDLMGRKQVRRVPVVDREDRLLGIISMADIANRADYDEDLQDAFERISSRRSFWSLFS